MRLISVKIRNFRQYKDLELFFPRNGNYDIHIVEASNGVGKTNLLNAINWCLYGDEPHKSGVFQHDNVREIRDDSNSLPLYNIEIMRELKESGGNICSVEVSVKLNINGEDYTFSRSKEFKVGSGIPFGQENITCKKMTSIGNTQFLERSEISMVLESVLPSNIREYFYFDGEQLLTYFHESKRLNVKDKVYTIAQINILDEVKRHLKSTIDYYKGEYYKKDPDLQAKEEKLHDAEQNFAELKNKLDTTVLELKKAEKILAEVDIAINGREYISVYNESYNDKKRLLKAYESDLENLNSNLNKFTINYLIKVLLYKNNQEVIDYINNRQKTEDYFTDLRECDIEESVNNCECKLCKQKLDKKSMQFLKYLLNNLKGNSSVRKIANLAPYIRKSLEIENFLQDKDELMNSIGSKNDQINELINEIDELDVKLKKFGSNAVDDVENLLQKKADYEKLLNKKREDRIKFSNQLSDFKNEVARLKSEYDKAIKIAAEQETTKKYWDFANNAYIVLQKVIDDLAESGRNLIASRTEKLFGELIWKKNTYGKVELAEDYSLKLYHKYNNQSCVDSCSASETELLALAFTLAVHEVSGYNSFLLIDTPVGRVSDANRKNFAEVLLKVSADKQIILEVTPSEYSAEIKEVLSQCVLSSYTKLYLKNNCVFKEK